MQLIILVKQVPNKAHEFKKHNMSLQAFYKLGFHRGILKTLVI